MPCDVRYDFPAPYDDFDCTVNDTNGTQAWSILCPAPANNIIPLEHSFVFDGNGNLASETSVWPWGQISTLTYGSLLLNPACTLTASDASGRPSVIRCIYPDDTFPDGEVILGDRSLAYEYDTFDRMTSFTFSETQTGRVVLRQDVSYDDVALRRSWTAQGFPNEVRAGDRGSNGYDLFDENLNIFESRNDDGDDSFTSTFSFDTSGRLTTTTVAHETLAPSTPSYSFVEHRIYDCSP